MMLTREIRVRVNGQPRDAPVRLTLADLLRETFRAHRHAPRVRARCVRRLHGAPRWGSGAFLPAAVRFRPRSRRAAQCDERPAAANARTYFTVTW